MPSLQAQPRHAPLGNCFPFPTTLVRLPGSRGPLPSHSCGHKEAEPIGMSPGVLTLGQNDTSQVGKCLEPMYSGRHPGITVQALLSRHP